MNSVVERTASGNIAVLLGGDVEITPIDAIKLAFLLLKHAGAPISDDLMRQLIQFAAEVDELEIGGHPMLQHLRKEQIN